MSAETDHAAPGLVVAISYQLKRALRALLSSYAGDSVGLEAPWDVSIFREGRLITAEEDKHTIRDGNPLTDRSVAWWKSLRNFTAGFVNGKLSDGCLLLLTTNASLTEGLAYRFRDDGAREDGWIAQMTAEVLAAGASLSKEIAPFVAYCGQHPEEFEQVIAQLVVIDRQSMRDEGQMTADILKLLRAPADDAESIAASLLGWMTGEINRAVLGGETAVIQVEAFNTRYRAEISRSREQRLLRRLDQEYAQLSVAKKKAQRRSLYYAQMRWIGLEKQPALIEVAVEDFLPYEIAITAYGEEGQVPRQRFSEREREIRDRWKFIFGGVTFGCDSSDLKRCEEVGRAVFNSSMQMSPVPLDNASTESLAFLTRGALQKRRRRPARMPEHRLASHLPGILQATS